MVRVTYRLVQEFKADSAVCIISNQNLRRKLSMAEGSQPLAPSEIRDHFTLLYG